MGSRLAKEVQLLPAASLAGEVVENGEAGAFRGERLRGHGTDVAAEAGEMIIAPIKVGDRVEGVLEVRTKHGERFPPQARAVAESISALLALQMARAKAEEERLRSEQERLAAQSEAERQRAENEERCGMPSRMWRTRSKALWLRPLAGSRSCRSATGTVRWATTWPRSHRCSGGRN